MSPVETPLRFWTLALLSLFLAPAAHASERFMTYTYQSGVLPAGHIELEPWTTVRTSRNTPYVRFDQRLEFELGMTDRLQTAFYLNMSAIDEASGPGFESELEFGGVSLEAKYKLMDPVADALGLALYFEPTFAPHEQEVEAKIIVDKSFGSVIVAANLVGEYEWEQSADGEREEETIIEVDLGVAYLLSDSLSVGLEVRNRNPIPRGESLESSALFAGPVLGYRSKSWWAAITVLPQVTSLAGEISGMRDLEHHERLETRLLFGMDL